MSRFQGTIRDMSKDVKDTNPEIIVALLNWNNSEETIGALKSLDKVGYDNFNVLIVDNGSEDDSVDILKTFVRSVKSYKAHFVLNKHNKGFAGGCNTALQWCVKQNKEYILFLNNDTEVDTRFLSLLVEQAKEKPDGAMFSPSIYFYDKRDVLWFGGKTHTSLLKMNKGMKSSLFKKKLPKNASIAELEFASGCAILCRTEVIKRVGGFDEKFFLYFEDVDLSFRVRKTGYTVYWVPQSAIYHKVSATTLPKLGSPLVHYYDVRNALLLNKKHGIIILAPYRLLWSFFTLSKQIVKITIKRNVEVSRAIQKAILDYYKGNFGKYE